MTLISIRKNYQINYRETNPITFNLRLPHGFPDSYATFDPEKTSLCIYCPLTLSLSRSPLITIDPLIFIDPLHSLSVSFLLSCETRQRDPPLFSLSLSRKISPTLALVASRDFAPFLRSLPITITLTPLWLPRQLWNSLISWTLLTFSLSLTPTHYPDIASYISHCRIPLSIKRTTFGSFLFFCSFFLMCWDFSMKLMIRVFSITKRGVQRIFTLPYRLSSVCVCVWKWRLKVIPGISKLNLI
jgi:hypothetical protein